MLDIALIRRDPDHVREAMRRRRQDPSFVDRVLELDAERRRLLTSAEALKAERNGLTASIKTASDRAAEAQRLRPAMADLDKQIVAESAKIPDIEAALEALVSDVPNLLDASVPEGEGSDENVLVRSWGKPRAFDFAPQQHFELGERLGILDFERAAKLSGSRFSILRGPGARLSRAIVGVFLYRAARRGYEEVAPPYLVSRSTMWSTGQLSKFADAMFQDQDRDLFMIPTAEVPLTALHRDEILAGDELPRRYTAYSPCFRKEAGAAGRDTRGLIRQHQFEKVELVWLTRPEGSFDALEQLTDDAAALLVELGLPHRIMLLSSGDTGFNAAKTYDLEVWLPGADMYREISSCSNCTDFQARRAGIRFRPEAKARPELVHTLNGSGLAVGRTFLAVLENYQQADGSIAIPPALVPFTGFSVIGSDGAAR